MIVYLTNGVFMGGNALKNIKPRRVDAWEYHEKIKPELMDELNHLFPEARFSVIPSLNQKQDFGDMDILLSLENIAPNWRYQIISNLNPRDVSVNANSKGTLKKETVFSFEYNDFQIDMIPIEPRFYHFAYHYYAYNDLGNLIGKIAKGIGFKFGHKGLQYKIENPDSPDDVQYILVSDHFHDSLDFLGFDFHQYNKGFDTLDSIFDFVFQNPYFSKHIFNLENHTHKDRIRDRKRPTYQQFLKAMTNQPDNHPFKPTDEEKDQLLQQALERFPEFKKAYHNALTDFKNKTMVKNKFNGTIVNQYTGLEQKALGQFINQFKNQFETRQDFDRYILNSNNDTIKQDIELFANQYQDQYQKSVNTKNHKQPNRLK